jgi:hypothetical protein
MNQQQYSREGERSYRGEARTNRGNSESRSNREGWTGLLNSMIKFTNAATMFTIQQVQNSFLLMTDSREAVNRFRRAMERLSESMNSEMDSSERSTVDQMNRAGEQMVNATASMMGVRDTGSRATGSRTDAGYRTASEEQPEEALSGRKR